MFAKPVRTVLVVLALMTAAKPAFAAPILSVAPSVTSTYVGASFFVDIAVTGVTDLFAFQFDVDYGPAPLRINGLTVTEGGFLPSAGGTTFTYDPFDNVSGTLLTLGGALSGAGSASGSGVLARLGFIAVRAGVTNIVLSNIQLIDSTLTQIDFDPPLRGVVQVPEPGTLALLAVAGVLASGRKWRAHDARAPKPSSATAVP